MSTLYTIKGWSENFEVSQSKKIQNALPWVAIPTKHDGKSYRRIMRMPNGPSIYAAWILLVQVAAKCDSRGVLADSDGPLTADDLEIKTDCPSSLFEEAFRVLSDPKIGWLIASEWEHAGSTVYRQSTEVDSETSTLPIRTDERTDITDGHNGRTVDSIESRESTDSIDLEYEFRTNPASKQISRSVHPRSKADRELIARVGLLVTSKRIPESWAFSAASAVAAKGSSVQKPAAFFRTCLEESCSNNGKNLASLLGESGSNRGPPRKRSNELRSFELPSPKAPL